MKYLTARILYCNDINDLPCQSLIPLAGTMEYDNNEHCVLIQDEEEELCIPLSKEQYIGIIQQLKVSDFVDTNYYCFRYTDEQFAAMKDIVYGRNKRRNEV